MTALRPPRLNPRKLLLSKWTAVAPVNKELHFIVTRLVLPAVPEQPIEFIEIEAVHSRRTRLIAWKALTDTACWRQGWC